MKRVFNRRLLLGILIAVFALAVMLVVFFLCMASLRKGVLDSVEQNLADVAEQNAIAIDTKIEDNLDLLRGIEKELYKFPGDPKDNMTKLKPFASANGLLRIAMCDTNGMSYSCNEGEESVDLSYREFYKRGMQGKYTVTEILYDALSAEHTPLNIISAPMYNSNHEIIGVIGLTYYSQDFNKSLQITSFEGKGYSFGVNEAGQVVVAADGSGKGLAKDFYADILGADKANAEKIEQIKTQLQGEGGTGTVFLDGVECYYYCKPAAMLEGDVNWEIVTVVPVSYMKNRIKTIDVNLSMLLVVLIVVIVLSLFGIMMLTRQSRRMVQRLAYVDKITEGDNLYMFEKRLNNMKYTTGAFVALDILDFRTINDALGVEGGNRVLRDIYKTLRACVKESELVAHAGLDDFALFLLDGEREVLIKRICEISQKLSALSEVHNAPAIKPRFGVYITDSRVEAELAYNRACQVTDAIHAGSEKNYAFYHGDDNKRYLRGRAMIDNFDKAIENKEFEIAFQPKFSAETRKLVGAEALVRWTHNDERISPGEFIALFEKNGQISRLDDYMMRNVCRMQREWLDKGLHIIPISVNVSRASLSYENLSTKYSAILDEYKLERKYIQIEATESSADNADKIVELLSTLRDDVGVKILMDDFGTGFSSLSLLSSGCFDVIKIDKSLTDNLNDPNGKRLFEHIVLMAKTLGLRITVEGVETEEQYQFVKSQKCDDIQGYYFSKPLSKAEFEKLIAE